ncbi:MAG: hypothetical protein IJG82_04085, partial [Atopobiaceae bacterium]|nr:hypothetical protein [Atopobiaceae bacterium]
LSQREERGGPEAADRLLPLISELSGDNEVALRDVPYAILSIWDSLGDKRFAFRTLADAAQAALAGDGKHIADDPSDRWEFISAAGRIRPIQEDPAALLEA